MFCWVISSCITIIQTLFYYTGKLLNIFLVIRASTVYSSSTHWIVFGLEPGGGKVNANLCFGLQRMGLTNYCSHDVTQSSWKWSHFISNTSNVIMLFDIYTIAIIQFDWYRKTFDVTMKKNKIIRCNLTNHFNLWQVHFFMTAGLVSWLLQTSLWLIACNFILDCKFRNNIIRRQLPILNLRFTLLIPCLFGLFMQYPFTIYFLFKWCWENTFKRNVTIKPPNR